MFTLKLYFSVTVIVNWRVDKLNRRRQEANDNKAKAFYSVWSSDNGTSALNDLNREQHNNTVSASTSYTQQLNVQQSLNHLESDSSLANMSRFNPSINDNLDFYPSDNNSSRINPFVSDRTVTADRTRQTSFPGAVGGATRDKDHLRSLSQRGARSYWSYAEDTTNSDQFAGNSVGSRHGLKLFALPRPAVSMERLPDTNAARAYDNSKLADTARAYDNHQLAGTNTAKAYDNYPLADSNPAISYDSNREHADNRLKVAPEYSYDYYEGQRSDLFASPF